ncbi:hypothetical protein ACJ8XG_01230 [Candidatus Nanosynbacter lyticus]|uniref:hypothetical protein n=1 Tax=Candidatus Nanosynbacter lyticus TaxID=2093824 RepID=UPI0038D1CD32
MTPEQLQSLSKAFSVSHLFDIFIQLGPYVLVVASILLGVSIVSSLIRRLRYHLIIKKYKMKDGDIEYDAEAYVYDLQHTLDHYSDNDEWLEPEEAEWNALQANEEYKRLTGEYYLDPQEIQDHYALRRS